MLEISSENFEKEVIESEAPVVVEFTAEWCGICERSQKLLSEMEKEMSDVKFCCVDIEKNKELAAKFSIKGVPTTIVFSDGNLKSRRTGLLTKSDLYSMIDIKIPTS